MSAERWLERLTGVGPLRMAVVYPNTYHVGMSNLGFHRVLQIASIECGVRCERAFAITAESVKRVAIAHPVRTLETNAPISAFDVVAFSVPFEGDYPHVVRALRDSNITLRTTMRNPREPLILGGGAALSLNPEPVADFFDAIVIGEAESVLGAVLETIAMHKMGHERPAVWEALAELPSVYIPSLSSREGISAQRIDVRQITPAHSITLTPETEFGDAFLIEIARGCSYRCYYCAMGHTNRPARFFTATQILDVIQRYRSSIECVGLVSAVVSVHPEIEEMAWRIVNDGLRLTVASLRADALPEGLITALAHGGARSITIAPETGTEQLRSAIGKPISDEEIYHAIALAERYGLQSVKLYFMLGLPSETDEDVQAISALVRGLVRSFANLRFNISIAPFVPKPHTPFQHIGMTPLTVLERRRKMLVESLSRCERTSVNVDSPRWAQVHALLSRGGRELSGVIERAVELGNSYGAWKRAVREVLKTDIDALVTGANNNVRKLTYI